MKIVILAGGNGQRLWPFSRRTFPKQFLHFGDGISLLQKTVNRFLDQEVFIVTGAEYAYMIKNQVEGAEILIEPERKNTGPALVFAVNELLSKGKIEKSETLLVAPSDQFLSPLECFMDAVDHALKAAQEGFLVTFGVKPTKPETGFGYIKIRLSEAPVKEVEQFKEKPSKELAEKYVKDSRYFWNSGIFLFQAAAFLREVEALAPDLLLPFEQRPSISIDSALFEKSKCVAMMPLDLVWSDVGSWDSLYEALQKDKDQCVKVGNVHNLDTTGSLLFGGKRVIATIGVKDLFVIETEDALLIGKRGEAQRVKEVVEALEKGGMKEAHEHMTIHRPWGHYSILEEDREFKIKRIVVRPGASLSLQKHRLRSEHWVVVKGRAKITLGEQELVLSPNQSAFVPKGVMHRLENPFEGSLEMIEVQVGDYLGEDDIERFSDLYGRELNVKTGAYEDRFEK